MHVTKKKILIDASSLILLYKAHVLTPFLKHFEVSCSAGVFNEITYQQKPGFKTFIRCAEKKLFTIITQNIQNSAENLNLGLGETETIQLYLHFTKTIPSKFYFICTDDKKAIKYCFANSIPFINALLVPKLLLFSNSIEPQQHDNVQQCLINTGRYSKAVIQYAKSCTPYMLQQFL